MQIVFNREVAEQLRERYTVLELETFKAGLDETEVTAFCVVPAEKLAFIDLEQQTENHVAYLTALNNKQWATVVGFYDTVRGMFGGELDSFYSETVSRANLYLGDV